MDIRIQSIHLLNFKGIRDLRLDFEGESKSLLGANATGKTSIFDAFMWVLFGKDSRGASQFDIKTLTPDGECLWKLPHEVTVDLLVDGKPTTLKKEYVEKWIKTRGEAEETFRGHDVNRYWNDVPCSAGEYDKKVAEICSEELFRLITNPMYFNSLCDKEKLELLNTLEGNTTDEQFMAASEKFAGFLETLNGKSLDEYKREISLKMRDINTELAKDNTRLDEVKRGMPEAEDWTAIESEISECDKAIAECKALQADTAKQEEAAGHERIQIQAEINKLTLALQSREAAISREVNESYNERLAARSEAQGKLDISKRELAMQVQNIDNLAKRKNTLIARLEVLTAEYKKIHSEIFDSKVDTTCPTCKQPLPLDVVEKNTKELQSDFNSRKAKRLQDNIDDGQNVQAEIKSIEDLIAKAEEAKATLSKRVQELEGGDALANMPQREDPAPHIEADEEVMKLRESISDLRIQLEEKKVPTDHRQDYAAEKEKVAQDRKSELKRRLYARDTIEAANKRIAEIEASVRSNSKSLLDLQRDDEMIKEIQKAKALYVEERINSQFRLVRFKMVDQQINGGERQICETTVGGVPYSSLNNASRINAGLDIINAFAQYNNITAPVFVDNAEAVNDLLPMQSQTIALVVTNDKVLTLK